MARVFIAFLCAFFLLAQAANEAAAALGNAAGLKPLSEAPAQELEEVPEISDADAAYNLGVKAYLNGRGNIGDAVEWFRKAANLGSAKGQYRLGVAYEWGEGVEKDYAKAFKWYSKAAKQKNRGGQYGLGSLYANGRGVRRDTAEAAKWFKLSANQGVAYAQYALGMLFLEGDGIGRNYRQAYFWLALAATSFDVAMEKRDEAGAHLSEEELQETRQRLMKWRPVLTIDEAAGER